MLDFYRVRNDGTGLEAFLELGWLVHSDLAWFAWDGNVGLRAKVSGS